MIVNRDEKRGRATSFAEVADAYERARPGYPDDAVRWLVGERPCDVVDLGAGTGKLTRTLVALGHRVTAVEPLPEMLAHLRSAVPEAAPFEGTAESIPLPDGSVDVVACAQAFHWFDHPEALPEIARVLRPGGHLALVWNVRDDRDPCVAQLSDVIGRETVDADDAEESLLVESGLFTDVETAEFSFAQALDRDTLRALVLSRSYCAVLPAEERAPVFAAVDRVFDEHAADGTIELPYVTVCYRATRLASA